MTARITTEERLSNMFGDSAAQAERDMKEGQQMATQWLVLKTKLPIGHPQYWAWKNAIVNELPWPPTTEGAQNDDSNDA
jgi:hypothetical protein